MFRDQSRGSRHAIRPLYVSVVGLPSLPVAGVNRARLVNSLHVVLSSEDDPLPDVTEQFVTRPLTPICRRYPVVPCSSFRNAADG